MTRILKGVWMLAAPPTWSASFVPMAAGYACAFLPGGAALTGSGLFWMAVSFIAMALIETGKHAVNDLVDFRTGNDPAVDKAHATPFSGGKKVLTSGLLSQKETIWIAAAAMALAAGLGLLIVWRQSFDVLWIGIAGMIIAVAYTMPPAMLCYRGLGEMAVGIAYGPLIFLGAYLMFSRENLLIPFLMSLHLAALIVNVLVINEYPDYEADLAAGKKNLIARVGKERGLRWYLGLFLASYIPVFCLTVYDKTWIWLITLAPAPLMWKAWSNCRKHYGSIPRLLLSNSLTIRIHMLSGALLIAAMALR